MGLSEVVVAFLLMQGAPSAAAPVSPPGPPRIIPAAEFAEQPLVLQPKLSPDGKQVLGRLSVKGRELIGVHRLEDGHLTLIPFAEKQDLVWYRWAGNGRILVSLSTTVPWFDEEAEMTRLFVYDLATGKARLVGKRSEGLEGDDLLHVDPTGAWALLSIQATIYDYPSVFRVDLATMAMKEVVRQRSDVWEWYADGDGVVRAGIGFSDNYWSMVYRKNAADKFAKVGKAKYDDEEAAMDLIRFARGSDEGFILSNRETGRYALYKYNFATRQRGERIFASDTNDVTDYSTNDDGSALRAVWYTDDRDRIVWFDEKMKGYQVEIDAAVRDNENWIISRTPDDSAMIVWTGASDQPGGYFLYRPDVGAMFKLAAINTKIRQRDLTPMRYVHYKARDGLDIPAYLTLPKGRPAKGLPLVILPHGGPYDVRDVPDYDPEVQFLANRGYAVLQPNYRGSGSYGQKFYEKGEGQWGRAMQDDLDDGMDWLVKEGIVDASRVCIVGSSYGGYAALWGATRNPERYRCAASFAGISDLGRQLRYQLAFRISKRYRKDWRKTVQGAEDFDTKTVSPLYQIDRLKVPLLIAHGDADQTVPLKQSRLYVDALAKAGKPYEFHLYEGEGHGFEKAADREDWLTRLGAFLARYNPAELTPPAPSP